MFKTVLLLLLCHHVLSQPVTEATKREGRQVGECCPCPDPKDVVQDTLAAGTDAVVDDCPCRPRSADSEGSSSMFFPTAIRPSGPLLKSPNSREDPKNLLQPEVMLATSMLDTLREATEEGYQDALAREATKSSTEPNDMAQEESAKNVVIVVHPRESDFDDDFVPDTPHAQETRCIHPLRSSLDRLQYPRPINTLSESLQVPKYKYSDILHNDLLSNRDSSMGASNLAQSVIDTNENSPRLPNQTPFLRTPNPLYGINNEVNNLISGKNPFTQLSDRTDEINNQLFHNIPELKLDNILRNPFKDMLNQNDLRYAPSSHAQPFSDASLIRQSFSPRQLKNLLKLRDVELIPKENRNKLLSGFATPSYIKQEQNDADNYDAYSFRAVENKGIERNINRDKYKGGFDRFGEIKQETDEDIKKRTNIVQDFVKTQQPNIENDVTSVKSELEPQDRKLKVFTEFVKNQIENKPLNYNLKSKESSKPFEKNQFSNEDKVVEIVNHVPSRESNIRQDSDISESNHSTLNTLPAEEDNTNTLPEKNIIDSLQQDDTCVQEEEISCNTDVGKQSDLTEALEEENMASNVKGLSQKLLSLQNNLAKGLEKLKKSSTNSELFVTSEDENIMDKNKKNANLETTIPALISSPSPEENKFPDDISTVDLKEDIDINQQSDMDHEASSMFNNIKQNSENDLDNIMKSTITSNNINNLSSAEGKDSKLEQNVYSDDLESKTLFENHEKEAKQNVDNREMDTGASDIFINTLPRTSNPFTSGLKSQIPSIDVRSIDTFSTQKTLLSNCEKRLSNILNERVTNVGHNNLIESMTPEGSVSNSQRKLPTLKALDNINADIFRNKLSSDSILKTPPKLNLNSYKTKLPIPGNLDLTPGHLASRQKDLKEAKIDFGSVKKTPLRKSKPSFLLGDHLETFSPLNELSNSLRPKTDNLLTKRVHPDLNPLSEHDNFNIFDDITDRFRENAQKTIKDLQRKMKTSLGKTKTNSILGDSYAKPEDLLEDVNDKLKAIHYDLNDRLSSIREEILDSSRLRTLANSPNPSVSKNVMTNLRSNKARTSPPRLQTSASTISAQEIDPLMQLTDDHSWQNPSRTPNTPEFIPATRNEVLSQTPLQSDMQRLSSALNKNPTIPIMAGKRPLTSLPTHLDQSPLFDNFKIPTLKEAISNLQDREQSKKVKISFGTTTDQPVPMEKSRSPAKSMEYKENSNILPIRERYSGLHEGTDAQQQSPDFNSLRAPTPLMLPKDSLKHNLPHHKTPNLLPSLHKERNDWKAKTTNYFPESKRYSVSREALDDKASNKKLQKVMNAPKVTENMFLSKLGDSVSKIFSNDSKNRDVSLESDPDMLRAASQDTNIVAAEPLKENVSYRCRIICSKE